MNALLQIGLSNAVVCGIMTVLLLPLAPLATKTRAHSCPERIDIT